MPLMSGIAFYEELRKRYEDVGKRFIFMSGAATDQMIDYFNAENIPFLKKPLALAEVRKALYKTLSEVTL